MERKSVILIFLISLLTGCKLFHGKQQSVEKPYNPPLQNFLFEQGCKNPGIDSLLSRHIIAQNKVLVYWDLYFPEYTGVAEGSDFYISQNDTADWVEELLARIEEERIAEELKQMESELAELAAEDSEEDEEFEESEEEAPETEEEPEPVATPKADEIEQFLNKDSDGKVYSDAESELKIYEFENEVLVRQKTDDGLILINTSGPNVTRNFYDNEMLLNKKEIWKISSGTNAELTKLEEYEYSKPGNKVICKKQTVGDQHTVIRYTESGLIQTLEQYVIYKKKQYTIQKRKCAYNDDGKIVSDEVIEYNYNGTDYKKFLYTFTKKYTYSYNEGDIPPDFSYYEDGVIKMKNKYSTEKGEYTSQVFFEEGMSVKSYYKNDVRVKDVFYSGNKVEREKAYETQ